MKRKNRKKKKEKVIEKKTSKLKCIMKRSFDTEEDALKEMKWLKIDRHYKKLKRAYICDQCNKYHLTKEER